MQTIFEEISKLAIPVQWFVDNHVTIEMFDCHAKHMCYLSPFDSTVPKVHVSESDYSDSYNKRASSLIPANIKKDKLM